LLGSIVCTIWTTVCTMNISEGTPVKASGMPVMALDIGGTWTRAACVSSAGQILASARERTRSWGTGTEFIDQCCRLLAEVRSATPDIEGDPRALGISVTGPVDVTTGTLFQPPNTGPALAGLRLREPLADALSLTVVVEKDTNAAALAEQRYGAARGAHTFVYLTVSTGVGASIVVDDTIVRGVDGAAGEVGHIVVDPRGPRCGCGRHGCLEAIASGPGIAAAARGRLEGREAGEGHDVAAAAANGDAVAQAVMAGARSALVSAVVDLANLLNPELIVLGGSVIAGNPDWVALAAGAVQRQALEPARSTAAVRAAALADDGGLLGAALIATNDGADVRLRERRA
jgi:glucokinase